MAGYVPNPQTPNPWVSTPEKPEISQRAPFPQYHTSPGNYYRPGGGNAEQNVGRNTANILENTASQYLLWGRGPQRPQQQRQQQQPSSKQSTVRRNTQQNQNQNQNQNQQNPQPQQPQQNPNSAANRLGRPPSSQGVSPKNVNTQGMSVRQKLGIKAAGLIPGLMVYPKAPPPQSLLTPSPAPQQQRPQQQQPQAQPNAAVLRGGTPSASAQPPASPDLSGNPLNDPLVGAAPRPAPWSKEGQGSLAKGTVPSSLGGPMVGEPSVVSTPGAGPSSSPRPPWSDAQPIVPVTPEMDLTNFGKKMNAPQSRTQRRQDQAQARVAPGSQPTPGPASQVGAQPSAAPSAGPRRGGKRQSGLGRGLGSIIPEYE
jgi:hypothetical protein